MLLTLGSRGAYIVRDGLLAGARCPLEDGEIKNEVGCGDAFLAGWVNALADGEKPKSAIKQAVAAGAASARGQNTVDYTREDMEELLTRCEEFGS